MQVPTENLLTPIEEDLECKIGSRQAGGEMLFVRLKDRVQEPPSLSPCLWARL
jgi:hypothetical protein